MKPIDKILSGVDRSTLRQRLGVGDTAISNAIAAGRFSSSWYEEVKALCDEAKIDCPLAAFKMRRAGSPAKRGVA